jgi:hypothetical protein
VAVALLLAAVVIPIAPSNLRAATAVTGLIAVSLTVAAVLGWRRALAWALVATVLEYALALADRPELDLRAPLVGAGLLVLGELISVTHSLGAPTSAQRGTGSRVGEALAVGLGAVVVGALVIGAAADQPRAGLLFQAASAAAAVGVLLLIARLARERARDAAEAPRESSPRVPPGSV